jgi:predicted lactoylglutathione lyase
MAEARSRKIFVNLAVRNLKKSMEFFSAFGFELNPKFTDENAGVVVVSDEGLRDPESS